MKEMKADHYAQLRQRYDDGSMSQAEWNGILDEYVAEDTAHRAGKVTSVPTTWETEYTFPVNEHLITRDYIRRYAFGLGDPNPLYRDSEYGTQSIYGTIIAPPIFQHAPAGSPIFPDKPEIPGLSSFYGGTENVMYTVYRPGDRIQVINKYLGIEEIKESGKPYRFFVAKSQRIISNERGEPMGRQTAIEIWTATPPGSEPSLGKDPFEGRTRPQYSVEQMEEIYQSYEDELAGKTRRGGEILYWEAVVEGEELMPLIRGPLDVLDVVSWNMGGGNHNMAFAWKWKAIKGSHARLIDPETGAARSIFDWHYQDSIAQAAGLPYAHSIGKQDEAIVATIISNWMGDDGFLKRLYCEHQVVWFLGETICVKGIVKRKYVENGEHLVDLSAWTELPDGKKCCVGEATVRLRSRAACGK